MHQADTNSHSQERRMPRFSRPRMARRRYRPRRKTTEGSGPGRKIGAFLQEVTHEQAKLRLFDVKYSHYVY